jgi:hypothetical protein
MHVLVRDLARAGCNEGSITGFRHAGGNQSLGLL